MDEKIKIQINIKEMTQNAAHTLPCPVPKQNKNTQYTVAECGKHKPNPNQQIDHSNN